MFVKYIRDKYIHIPKKRLRLCYNIQNVIKCVIFNTLIL